MSKNTILIVDDEIYNLKVLFHTLNKANFKVLVAKSGAEALRRVTIIQPDIIILDINMPNMDGFELCYHLRENTTTKNTPIIFLSANVEATKKIKGLEMGAVDYITKPFVPDELVARVKNHLTIYTLQKELKEKNIELQQTNQNLTQEIAKRQTYEKKLENYTEELEEEVKARTKKLQETQEQLIRQQKLAAVGQISASIAHELRNPLGAIGHAIYYLNRLHQQQQLTFENPKVAKHLNLIQIELDRSQAVITNLLESTKAQTPKPQSINLKKSVLEAVERLHKTRKYHLQLQFALNPEPFTLSVDQTQFQQVLFNLLSNAAQAKSKQIIIEANLQATEKQYQIKIKDNGTGIASKDLSKIFAPLYTTKTIGTGLGLTICQQIIKKHGGRLTVSSKINKGTTIEILLPYSD